MMELRKQPPPMFYAYVAGLGLLYLWGLLPSEVNTSYNLQGLSVVLLLLVGLGCGFPICRWVLFAGGMAAAFGSFMLQSEPIEFVATTWSVFALGVSALLLTRSMRHHTGRDRRATPSSGDVTVGRV